MYSSLCGRFCGGWLAGRDGGVRGEVGRDRKLLVGGTVW